MLYIYGDESGQIGGKYFLIGLLFVASKSKAGYEQQIQRMKIAHKFTHRELHYSDSENHNLLQVVDLLAGCVNGDLNGVQKFDKRTVIDHLKSRLGITDFLERNAYTKEKFRVNLWKPPLQK